MHVINRDNNKFLFFKLYTKCWLSQGNLFLGPKYQHKTIHVSHEEVTGGVIDSMP